MEQFITEAIKEFRRLWAEDDEPRLRTFAKDFLISKLSQVYTLGLRDGKEEGKKEAAEWLRTNGRNQSAVAIELAFLTNPKTEE